MRKLFIILDTSGSVALEGSHKVGQINDLVRDLLSFTADSYEMAYLITYSNLPRIYWSSMEGNQFEDIPASEFGGRSNLGRAYSLVKEILETTSETAANAEFVLISDGEATDNYTVELEALDPGKKSTRVAGGIGMNRDTLDRHVSDPSLVYTDVTGLISRDEFFDEVKASLKK